MKGAKLTEGIDDIKIPKKNSYDWQDYQISHNHKPVKAPLNFNDIDDYIDGYFSEHEKEIQAERRALLQLFFRTAENQQSDERTIYEIANEELSLIKEYYSQAYRLGYVDYESIRGIEQIELTPSTLGSLRIVYFNSILSQFLDTEQQLMGQAADMRWAKEDHKALVEAIKKLDDEATNLDRYEKELGYSADPERTSFSELLLLSEFESYKRNQANSEVNSRQAWRLLIQENYDRMQGYLSFLNYQDLAEVSQAYGTKRVIYTKELERFLEAEKKECDRLLGILGYESLDAFDQKVPSKKGSKTRDRLAKEKEAVERNLKALGFEVENLQQTITQYRELNAYPDNYRQLLQAEQKGNIWYANSGKKYNTVNLEVGKNSPSEDDLTLRCIEVPGHPNNFIRVSTDKNIPIEQTLNRVQENYSREILSDEVELLSLVNESSTNDLLEKYKKNTIRLKFNKQEDKLKKKIEKRIKRRAGKSIFILGHVEGEQFVTKLEGGGFLRLNISEVIDWGKRHKVNIFAFGCNTARVIDVGTRQFLNSVEDGLDMINAIQKSRTVGDVFKNYLGETRKIIVDGETFKDQQFFRIKVMNMAKIAGGTIAIGIAAHEILEEQSE